MFNWIKKWLTPAPVQAPLTTRPTAPPPGQTAWTVAPEVTPSTAPSPAQSTLPPSPEAPPPASTFTEFNAQTASLHWVFGLDEPSNTHGLTLDTLADIVERMSLDTNRAADWVPRVPTVLPGLLKSLRDEHSSAHDLAQQIEQDVTLLSEALKEANSALHQRSTPVTQTEEAVRLLGSHGLRLLIARVAFRPVLGPDAGALTRLGASRVWQLGEACANASKALATARGVDPFEAFLAGLALNVGLLVSLRMADRVAHLSKPDTHGLGPRSVPVGEDSVLGDDNHAAQDVSNAATILSHRVAARWELPENVVGAITAQVDAMAQRRWHAAAELLGVAQETARLHLLYEAGLLPGSLADCSLHLPDDARQWLLHPPPSVNADDTPTPTHPTQPNTP